MTNSCLILYTYHLLQMEFCHFIIQLIYGLLPLIWVLSQIFKDKFVTQKFTYLTHVLHTFLSLIGQVYWFSGLG